MPHIHLFEFLDLPWWPRVLRDQAAGYLEALLVRARPFTPSLPLIAEALRRSHSHRLLDLGSGAGGPWRDLAPQLSEVLGEPVHVLLSDLHVANGPPLLQSAQAEVTWSQTPVNALAVPADAPPVRTLIDVLHHFRPDDAQRILKDAVARRAAVVVLEGVQHSMPAAVAMLLIGPLLAMLLMPLVRPWRWIYAWLTYAVPIGPLAIAWDGFVSILRCYTPDELRAMAQAAGPDYEWQAGTYRHHGVGVTYLIGWPAAPGSVPT